MLAINHINLGPSKPLNPRLKQLEKAEAAGDAVGVEVVWYAFQGAAAVKRRGKTLNIPRV